MNENIVSHEPVAFKGTVQRITYRNEQNYYTVATVISDGEDITVVGALPFLNEGDFATFNGTFTVHPTYGSQFKVSSFERSVPETSSGILRYLASGAIKGIGPSTAERIVKKFKEQTLDIIHNSPEQLATLKGISIQKAIKISQEYSKQYGVRDIMLLLSKYSVSPEACIKIYQKIGSSSPEKIKENPYILCDEDIDISFEKIELIASDFQISPDNKLRISAGLEYILRKNLMNGHTCLPKDKLVSVAVNLLGCTKELIEETCRNSISQFCLSSTVIDKNEYISIPVYTDAEEHIAARLLGIKQHIENTVTIDDLEIEYVENKLGITFEALQKEAIKRAFENGILILTGGPGTGKTTTLNAIISLFEKRNMEIELAAPTGRAAKRITELTGMEAKTIHRLLEVEWGSGDKQMFSRNEQNPLKCDVIIIDEASMIDVLLFDNLIKALRISCRIILVGDTDQLPSISAGNVLSDLLCCDLFPSIRLQKVFRQAGKSLIVTNAHSIIKNEPVNLTEKNNDFFFLQRFDKYDVLNTIIELINERLPKAYGFNPLTDIQILCPSRKMDTGTVNLNNILQETLNPKKKDSPQLAFKGFYLRIGDKVMQIKNNYDLEWVRDNGEESSGIFNGDIGFITDIDIRAGMVRVRYDDRVATYFSEDISQLELAYAVTVHKSQGSEFECVIIPVFDTPAQLKYRNLLYTAVTRAKRILVLVGSEYIFNQMAANDKKTLRYTMLKYFLSEAAQYYEEFK